MKDDDIRIYPDDADSTDVDLNPYYLYHQYSNQYIRII